MSEEKNYKPYIYGGLGVLIVLVILGLLGVWNWKRRKNCSGKLGSYANMRRLHYTSAPGHNIVQSIELEEKDSLEEHLDVLTRKLAEKEGRLRISKSKIRETQLEIDSLCALEMNVHTKYVDIMDALRKDLRGNEKECKKLQEQIEWVSRRRAELKDEVNYGKKLYGVAAAELATNLCELQRGRVDQKPIENPLSAHSLRCKEPELPKSAALSNTINLKTSSNIPSPKKSKLKEF